MIPFAPPISRDVHYLLLEPSHSLISKAST